MVNNIFYSAAVLFSLGTATTATAQKTTKPEVRFINDIQIDFSTPSSNQGVSYNVPRNPSAATTPIESAKSVNAEGIESASLLQFEFALMLDTDVESITNQPLFTLIQQWLGTPYRYGGAARTGIDCSAFMQTLFSGVHGLTIPRTAREQHKFAAPVEKEDLKEGDLVFFNTTGGVSHVGYYLQNNKFVHAASSGGVMVSDLSEDYWSRRFISAGRIELVSTATLFSQP
jgi:lipoprotein Spr